MGAGSSVGTPVSTSSRESLDSRRGFSPPAAAPSTTRPKQSSHERSQYSPSPSQVATPHSSSTELASHHSLPQRRSIPSPPLRSPLSKEQRQKVIDCLSTLESAFKEFGVHFNDEDITSQVVVTTQEGVSEDDEGSVNGGRYSGGIFILDEGSLEVSCPDEESVLYRLLPGDFFGELSTLFKVQYNSKVNFIGRVTLLQLPSSVIQQCTEGGELLGRGAMLKWCIKRSIFDSSGVFDSTDIAQKILVSCFKASLLSEISDEAIDFVASLAKPVLFSEGDTLYSAGDDPCYIYFILRGQLERYTESEELLEPMRYVRFSDEGFSVGAKQFFSGEKLPHIVKAAGPVLVAPVGREILLEMSNKYPSDITKLRDLLEKYRNNV